MPADGARGGWAKGKPKTASDVAGAGGQEGGEREAQHAWWRCAHTAACAVSRPAITTRLAC